MQAKVAMRFVKCSQRVFAAADMVCIVEHVFRDGEWAILEWRDPKGPRGCGFFHIIAGKIALQR
jgi:hypothetical protein